LEGVDPGDSERERRRLREQEELRETFERVRLEDE